MEKKTEPAKRRIGWQDRAFARGLGRVSPHTRAMADVLASVMQNPRKILEAKKRFQDDPAMQFLIGEAAKIPDAREFSLSKLGETAAGLLKNYNAIRAGIETADAQEAHLRKLAEQKKNPLQALKAQLALAAGNPAEISRLISSAGFGKFAEAKFPDVIELQKLGQEKFPSAEIWDYNSRIKNTNARMHAVEKVSGAIKRLSELKSRMEIVTGKEARIAQRAFGKETFMKRMSAAVQRINSKTKPANARERIEQLSVRLAPRLMKVLGKRISKLEARRILKNKLIHAAGDPEKIKDIIHELGLDIYSITPNHLFGAPAKDLPKDIRALFELGELQLQTPAETDTAAREKLLKQRKKLGARAFRAAKRLRRKKIRDTTQEAIRPFGF